MMGDGWGQVKRGILGVSTSVIQLCCQGANNSPTCVKWCRKIGWAVSPLVIEHGKYTSVSRSAREPMSMLSMTLIVGA